MNFCMIADPVEKVSLSCSNLARSLAYWNQILGLKIFSQDKEKAVVGFSEPQAKLELQDIGKFVRQTSCLSLFIINTQVKKNIRK